LNEEKVEETPTFYWALLKNKVGNWVIPVFGSWGM
jgi:hypothetical protein